MFDRVQKYPPGVFYKKGVLKIFAKSTGKQHARVFAALLKKIIWLMCFPVNFANFLRTPFLTEHLQWRFYIRP